MAFLRFRSGPYLGSCILERTEGEHIGVVPKSNQKTLTGALPISQILEYATFGVGSMDLLWFYSYIYIYTYIYRESCVEACELINH